MTSVFCNDIGAFVWPLQRQLRSPSVATGLLGLQENKHLFMHMLTFAGKQWCFGYDSQMRVAQP